MKLISLTFSNLKEKYQSILAIKAAFSIPRNVKDGYSMNQD